MADTARTHHDITSRDQYPLLGRDRDQYPYGRSDYQTSSQDYSKTRQIAKAATAVTAGGSLLVLSSLTLVGTVIALTVATPLLVIFSPILVPALITVALLITGFLSSGGFGIAAITVFSWISSKKQRKSLQYRGRGMLRAAGSGMLRAAGRGLLGAAGRGMLRAAGRAMKRTGGVKGGVKDPFASSTSTPAGNASVSLGGGYANKFGSSSGSNNLRITASGSLLSFPVAATSRSWSGGAFSFNSYGAYEDFEWVTVEGTDEEEEDDDSVFGSVPSVDEVEDAVSALKQ